VHFRCASLEAASAAE